MYNLFYQQSLTKDLRNFEIMLLQFIIIILKIFYEPTHI